MVGYLCEYLANPLYFVRLCVEWLEFSEKGRDSLLVERFKVMEELLFEVERVLLVDEHLHL